MVVGAFVILQKLQVSFAKRAELRFLSHHDLMRTFHRALRRAGLPVRMTSGFNPRPRVVFPHALEVGIPSDDEAVEVEITAWTSPADFGKRLGRALPVGLDVLGVSLLPPVRRGRAAVEAHYEADLSPEQAEAARAGVERFMAGDSWPIERVDHDGSSRRIDLRPHVLGLSVEGSILRVRLRLGRPGAARPREVIAAVLGRMEAERQPQRTQSPGSHAEAGAAESSEPSVSSVAKPIMKSDPMLDIPLRKTKTVLASNRR